MTEADAKLIEEADVAIRSIIPQSSADYLFSLVSRLHDALVSRGTAQEWRPIDTAPKDGTRVYLAGHWDERSHHPGKPHVCIGAWSTWMSNGTGYQWIYEGSLGNMRAENIAVTFTHWLPIPPPPDESKPT